ncbi:MAG: hypothetical protein ACOYKE_03795 [Ferruginibacter sp.]
MKKLCLFLSMVYCVSVWAQDRKLSIVPIRAFEHQLQPLLKAHSKYIAALNNHQGSAAENKHILIQYEENRNNIIQLKIRFITENNQTVEALKMYAGLFYWLDYATRKRVFKILHPTLHKHSIAIELAALLQ